MAVDARRGSVLLVEDDPDYCQLLREAFQEAGFRTVVAGNGERALEILKAEPVDLVVSDFIMPELNGLELCRLLSNDVRTSRPKVILYSCNTDSAFRRKARELGALEYLPKTDDTDALVHQVCQLAGLETEGVQVLPPDGGAALEQRLHAVSQSAGQLRVLLASMLDFTRILALSDQSPAGKLAWEAVQRTGSDIQRILIDLETVSPSAPPIRSSEAVSR
jgi:DNA-binding response OmpR family regulator